jgi:multicomponent Na+:H+ antiporter subunit B
MTGTYTLLRIISRFLLPFVLLFGLYIVINGDLTPGGGFQGGVVLASSYILLYFIGDVNKLNTFKIIRFEKILFMVLVVLTFMSRLDSINTHHMFYLVALNMIIGVKVALGIGAIIMIFLEEGNI